MKIIDNITEIVRDDLRSTMKPGSRVSYFYVSYFCQGKSGKTETGILYPYVDIGCERGNNSYNMVNRMEPPFATQYMQLFDSLWNDREKMQDVTEEIISNISTVYNENSPEFIYFNQRPIRNSMNRPMMAGIWLKCPSSCPMRLIPSWIRRKRAISTACSRRAARPR